ncbi:hypothetical protein ABB37_04175 [Leptomonas pyrrhocoris]|uniref:DNA repair protein n=1 Tax=Leptomonas pyrrhocoris TaxID=157538 RepID=A0A0M9G4H6_LEPPY|nr:hypothetical protein ABB37_04175 [Leptomonas pyrrhocoris]XP_015660385.1 hypothetical protein ABB37_04175 [Leptomonas pyrrhocoris]KPA81945.1 hypothetical protein ABB37_04175 [Leptomonas pyrrhocoris]KPA81946.1 hypothetical protein ABB37_04175 [Leptomonas pyrrhocoris]|eukprot:XP_015660384.1 hypothetical protein ABB37_04175 [Leptomonas pyrrhocoris]
MSSHTIVCSSRWARHEVTQTLLQRRIGVEVNSGLHYCDFVCGASSVLYYELQSAEAHRDQALIVSRLAEARRQCGTQPVILMVWMTNPEPSLEVLSWLNLECGVAQQCGLLLVWSVEDVVQFLASLVASAVTSLEFSVAAHQDVRDAPLPVLIDALTQTPQIVTRNDVVRIANRKTCLADVLMSEAGDWEGIAGLGHKKATRLQHLFRMPFLSSQQTVESFINNGDAQDSFRSASFAAAPAVNSTEILVLPSADDERLAPALSSNQESGSTTLGKDGMLQALQRKRDEEDAEDV